MRFAAVLSVAAVALIAGCRLSGTPYTSSGGGTPPPNAVYMQDLTFNPVELDVAAGATVTWTNQDIYTHTVIYSAGPDSAFSDTVAAGATFRHTFKTAGTYQYYCILHGTPTSGMHATVVAR
jgi:plastocyanin